MDRIIRTATHALADHILGALRVLPHLYCTITLFYNPLKLCWLLKILLLQLVNYAFWFNWTEQVVREAQGKTESTLSYARSHFPGSWNSWPQTDYLLPIHLHFPQRGINYERRAKIESLSEMPVIIAWINMEAFYLFFICSLYSAIFLASNLAMFGLITPYFF